MREDRDVPPRITIGSMARRDHQAQHWCELYDADEPERPRIARAFVQLPTDGDVDHLPSGDGGESPDGEMADERVPEGGVGVDHGARDGGKGADPQPSAKMTFSMGTFATMARREA